MDLIGEFLNPEHVIAVVGVSRDSRKYGNRVYFKLKSLGYRVYAVNPKIESVNGDRVYASISSLPVKPDVVNLVVPPAVGIKIVREAFSMGVSRIWLQPGAESEEIIRYCKEKGLKLVWGQCIMVEAVRSLYK